MDVGFIIDIMPEILEGFSTTVRLFLWSMLFSTPLGLALALMRLSPLGPFRWVAGFYGWLVRGIPLILIMFYVFFALPEFGKRFCYRRSGLRSRRSRFGRRAIRPRQFDPGYSPSIRGNSRPLKRSA